MGIKPPNTKASTNVISAVFGCLIAAIILAFILVIFLHPIKYSFYVFSLTLAGLLFLIIFRYRDGFETAITKPVKLIDCVMMIFASIILFSNIVGSHSSEVTFLAALIVLFFLPGWALLRTLGLDRIIRGSIELFVLSFSLSVILSALILLSGLFFDAESGTFNKFVALTFFSISIIPFITRWWISQKESASPLRIRYNYSELLCIAWLSIFFIFVIWNLYPGMAYYPGYDIVRHYSYFRQVFEAPDIYFSNYPWFHFVMALLDQISLHPSMELMQSGLAMMSIVVIFSFYMMARSYLVQIDSRAPLIATILFTVFGGFGWIYFLQQVGTISDLDQEWLALGRSAEASYSDIGIGVPTEIWLWFRPLTLGFAFLFVLLYLLNSKELSRPIYLAITSALVVGLMQIHISELVIFALLIWIVALFFPSIKLRTKEAAISILIGIFCSSILSYSYSYIFNSTFASMSTGIYISLIAVLAGTSLIFLRKTKRIKFGSLRINWNLVIAILGAAYLILLFFWNSISDNFKQESVIGASQIFGVPWEFYPLLLGIVGLLAIPGIIIILKNSRNHPVVIFVALFLLAMVLGRALTFLNANSIFTDYWERRLIPVMQASASVVASVVILQIVKWLEGRSQRSSYARYLKSLLLLPILSILILTGSLSTFSTFEYHTLKIDRKPLTDIEKAQSPFGRFDPYTTILTVTDPSRNIAEFSHAGHILGDNRYQLWPSQSPELPLKFLYGLNDTAVVYLSPNDVDQINEGNYANKYIASHLLPMSIPYNISSAVGTHQLPKLVPVAPKSDTVLVVPEKVDRRFYYAYDILSQSGYNYTTAIQSDINSISKARIIIAPSETIATELIRHKEGYNLQYEYLIILNLDGYGEIARPTPSNSTFDFSKSLNSSSIEGPDYLKSIQFPTSMRVPLVTMGPNYTSIAYYDVGVPFVSRQYTDSYTIYYFNVYPLTIFQSYQARSIQNIDSGDNASTYYKILGKIMGAYNLPLRLYEFKDRNPSSLVADLDGAFEYATFSGDLSIKSNSAIIEPSNTTISVRINGHDVELENISQIIPINSSSVTIKASKGIISGGGAASSFYSNVSVDQSIISFSGEQVRVILKDSFGNQISEISASNIEISLSKADVLIREPQIDSIGTTIFNNLYGYGEGYEQLRVTGSELSVTGETSFQADYSDKFTIFSDLAINGKIIRSDPLYGYDELGSLIDFASDHIVLIAMVGLILYFFNRYKIIPNRESTWLRI